MGDLRMLGQQLRKRHPRNGGLDLRIRSAKFARRVRLRIVCLQMAGTTGEPEKDQSRRFPRRRRFGSQFQQPRQVSAIGPASPQRGSWRRVSICIFSNQLPNRVAVIDEVLRPSRLIGDRGVSDINPETVVERVEDFLIVDRAILRDFAKSVR